MQKSSSAHAEANDGPGKTAKPSHRGNGPSQPSKDKQGRARTSKDKHAVPLPGRQVLVEASGGTAAPWGSWQERIQVPPVALRMAPPKAAGLRCLRCWTVAVGLSPQPRAPLLHIPQTSCAEKR